MTNPVADRRSEHTSTFQLSLIATAMGEPRRIFGWATALGQSDIQQMK